MYKREYTSLTGHRAICSRDVAGVGKIKTLKEAYGGDVKRQVVDFIEETVSIKKERASSSYGQQNFPVT